MMGMNGCRPNGMMPSSLEKREKSGGLRFIVFLFEWSFAGFCLRHFFKTEMALLRAKGLICFDFFKGS